jgi:hypothetical protein
MSSGAAAAPLRPRHMLRRRWRWRRWNRHRENVPAAAPPEAAAGGGGGRGGERGDVATR